jgi:hypothetical protein
LGRVGVHTEDDASPLGAHSATPWAAGEVTPGRWTAVAIGLGAGSLPDDVPEIVLDEPARLVVVRWPDGSSTAADLPHHD